MANPGDLALLLHDGVDRWNEWRKHHKEMVPDLEDADLRKVDLAGGNGIGANLYPANLRGANLFGANLQGVSLREANLANVQVGFTIFGDTNLSGAVGLEECRHVGPSVVDHQTMMKVVAASCGVPAWLRPTGNADRILPIDGEPADTVLLLLHQLFHA